MKNIVFTSDISYIDKFIVVIKSILTRHKSGITFHLILADQDSVIEKSSTHPQPIIDCIDNIKQFDNVHIQVHYTQIEQEIIDNICFHSHLNENVFLRFEIPKLPLTGRILYLDLDLLVLNDLNYLFNCDLHGARFAMASEFVWRPSFHNKDFNYLFPVEHCNAGVMVMDLDKIHYHGDNWYEEFMKYPYNYFNLYDQDFFNHHYSGDRLIISERYNFNCMGYSILDAEQHTIWQSPKFVTPPIRGELPAIVHWNGPHKPWLKDNMSACPELWQFFDQLSFAQIKELDSSSLDEKIFTILENSNIYSIPHFTTRHANYITALHSMKPRKGLFGRTFDRSVTSCKRSYMIGDKLIEEDCTEELKLLTDVIKRKKDISLLPPMIAKELRRFLNNEPLYPNLEEKP